MLIETVEHIIHLDAEEKEYLLSLFTTRQYKKGDLLLKEGQVCKEVGFIEKGLVRYFINKEGEELISEFGKERDFVCNYQSFLDHSPSTRNIQAIEDVTLLVISYNDLQLMYKNVKEGEKFGRLVCEQIFVSSLKQITSLYTDPPETRYLQFIQTYPDLQQRIPQYYISSYIGVKPQSLSRIRKRLIN